MRLTSVMQAPTIATLQTKKGSLLLTTKALTQRNTVGVVHLSAQDKVEEGLPAGDKEYGLSRSYSQRPIGHTILVKAEFVYADAGAMKSVSLLGDWNGWVPVPMRREEKGFWIMVCVMPTGLHEFCFVVDGVKKPSSRHPRTANGKLNRRNVRGPPSGNAHVERSKFYLWAQKTLTSLGTGNNPDENGEVPGSRRLAEMNLPNTSRLPRRLSLIQRFTNLDIVSIVIGTIAMYFLTATLFALTQK